MDSYRLLSDDNVVELLLGAAAIAAGGWAWRSLRQGKRLRAVCAGLVALFLLIVLYAFATFTIRLF